MPFRLDNIIDGRLQPAVRDWLLDAGLGGCESFFIGGSGGSGGSGGRRYNHLQHTLKDAGSGSPLGRLVYTVAMGGQPQDVALLDLDLVLENDRPTPLRFLELLPGSSPANEYYIVETAEEQRLVVETVDRHTEAGPLLGTEREVRISLFPFQADVFDSIDAFDRWAGFTGPSEPEGSERPVTGFSERFAMPEVMPEGEEEGDGHHSFLLGTVRDLREVTLDCGASRLPLLLAWVDTALGPVPAALSREAFDLSRLRPGCLLALYTYVKADIAPPGVFEPMPR